MLQQPKSFAEDVQGSTRVWGGHHKQQQELYSPFRSSSHLKCVYIFPLMLRLTRPNPVMRVMRELCVVCIV